MIESIPTIVQFILGLALLVGIHEGGHMFFAKLFGMRVEKFSIGFGPVLFWFKKGETTYQLSAIPLGGYVKILGMVDESMATAQLEKDPEPWEFRAKPAWQRLFVMLGGIIFNIILGCVIFSGMLFYYGESYTKISDFPYGIIALEIGEKIGLKDGDQILEIDGRKIETSSDLFDPEVYLGNVHTFIVQRDGKAITLNSPEDYSILNDLSKKKGLLMMDYKFKVGKVIKGSRAEKSGLLSDDIILMLDSNQVHTFSDFINLISEKAGAKIELAVRRDSSLFQLYAFVDTSGKIGFYPDYQFKPEVHTIKYGFGESLVKGTEEAFFQVYFNLKSLKAVFSGQVEAKNAIGGPIAMAQSFGTKFNFQRFWAACGMLSMALALFNLFPIPALDGGHVIFLLWEMMTGKKPSQKIQEISIKIGMLILLSFMVIALFLDFSRL